LLLFQNHIENNHEGKFLFNVFGKYEDGEYVVVSAILFANISVLNQASLFL